MVFLSTNVSLEQLLKEDKNTLVDNKDWFLYDSCIKTKSLTYENDKRSYGYLSAYMDRIFYYPIFYATPLYCYLFSDKYWNNLRLFPNSFDNKTAIWKMTRVPDSLDYNFNYPKIQKEKQIFGNLDYYGLKDYIKVKFEQLVDCNLNDIGISCVILGKEV